MDNDTNEEYAEAYMKGIEDAIFSILTYSPQTNDYTTRYTMQCCREDIAAKVRELRKDIHLSESGRQ